MIVCTSCTNVFPSFAYAAASGNPTITTKATLPPGVTLDGNTNQEPIFDPPHIVEWEDPSATDDVYALSSSLSTTFGIQSLTDEIQESSSSDSLAEKKESVEQESKLPVPFVADFLLSDEQVGDLMLAGAGAYDRYQIHLLLSQQKIDPLEIWKKKKESGLTWKEWIPKNGFKIVTASTVSQSVYGVFTEGTLQHTPLFSQEDSWNPDETTEQDRKQEDQSEPETIQQDTYGLETNPMEHSLISTMAVSSGDEASVNNFQKNMDSYLKLIAPLQINQIYKEQYADRQKTSESIDPATGALTWKFNALHYPGRDGLDMDLGLMYQSNQATSFLEANALIPVIVYRDGTASLQYKNIAKSEWANENYLFDTFQLGNGWSFQLPSLQIERPKYGQTTYYYYHNGQGASYQVEFDKSATNLVNAPNKLTRFMRGGNFSNGQTTAAYYMEYPNKKREYFNDQGQLIGVVDRFQNKITYEYGGSPLQYIQMTDTVGRKLRIEYQRGETENTVTVYSITPDGQKKAELVMKGQPQKWQARQLDDALKNRSYYVRDVHPILRSLSYVQDDANGNRQYVWTSKFNYKENARAEFSYTSRNWNTKEGVGTMAAFPLSEIEYPRSQTYYDYTRVVHNMGADGLQMEYVVSQRADEPKKQDGSKQTNLVNQVQYTYTGDYTGFPQVTSQQNMPANYTYQQEATVMEQGHPARVTTTRFNYKGQQEYVQQKGINDPIGRVSETKVEAYDSNFKFNPTRTSETISDSSGTITRYTEQMYDTNGNLTQVTAPLTAEQLANADTKQKRSTLYTYESQYNQIQTQTVYQNDSTPQTTTYAYTSDGRVSMVRDPLGQETTTTYTRAADGVVSQVATERPVRAGVKARTVTNYGADTGYVLPAAVSTYFRSASNSTQLQNTQTFRYDPRTGMVSEETDGDGKTTQYTYDALDRIIRVQKPALTNTDGEVYTVADRYQYEDGYVDRQDGSPIVAALIVSSDQETNQKTNGAQLHLNEHIATYDGFGITLTDSVTDRSNPASPTTKVIRYTTDTKVRPVQQTTAVYRGTASTGLQLVEGPTPDIRIAYDRWDQLVTTTDVQGNTTTITSIPSQLKQSLTFQDANGNVINAVDQQYDQWGNLTQTTAYQDAANRGNPIRETYTYDIAGNVLTYTDPETNGNPQHARNRDGMTQSYTYDALNRPIRLLNALNQASNYEYDGNNQLIKASVQDAEQTAVIFSKDFNETSQMLSKTDPANASTQNQYDAMGRLKVAIDRKGISTTYTYDEWGQPKVISEGEGTANALKYTYTYGKNNIQTKQLRMEGPSALEKMEQQTQTDLLGRIVQQTARTLDSTTQPAYAGGMSLTYNGQGQVASMHTDYQADATTVQGTLQQYTYDSKQRLTNIAVGNSNQTIQYAYTPQGSIASITYPTMASGKVMKSSYTYDALNHMTQMTTTLDGALLASSNYTYDRNGNVLQTVEKRADKADHTTSYTYDSVNRLIGVNDSVRGSTTYTYDLRGNRRLQSVDKPSTAAKAEEHQYTYDLNNRLKQVRSIPGEKEQAKETTTSFAYLPDGTRFQKKVTESTGDTSQTKKSRNYISNGDGKVIFEAATDVGTSDSGTLAKTAYTEYIRGDRVLLKKQQGSAKLYYYLYNGHGDVIGILNDDGSVANTYDYDPFGNVTEQQEQTDNAFKYAGEYLDADTGLYYLNARYYDPSMGRFINEDTYEGQINNPLSMNLYTYVHNNPLIYVDPTGHLITESYKDGELRYLLIDARNHISSKSDEDYQLYKDKVIEIYEQFVGNNRYNYLFDLATGTSSYGNSAGKSDWAIAQLISAYQDYELDEYITTLAMGSVGGKGYSRGKGKGSSQRSINACQCFTAGTKVKTDQGEKDIEDIQVGDQVLSKDEKTGEVEYKVVTATFNHETDDIYKISVGDQVIESTFNHPFYVRGKGWTFVKDLKVGDLLVRSDGNTLNVKSVEILHKQVIVYNMTIDEFHTYFVSNLGIWVHNSECEVAISKAAARVAKKLSPEAKKGYTAAIKGLESGDLRGLNAHPLSGKNRKGQWAVDIKGSGVGRGDARVIYTKESDGKINVIEVITTHNDY